MAAQFKLDFANVKNFAREDFIVSEANFAASTSLYSWPAGWQIPGLLLYGPELSGKTHLANIWAIEAAARFIDEKTSPGNLASGNNYIIENIENLKDENWLFHIINSAKEKNCFLLITSRLPLAKIDFHLPDLASRLKAFNSFSIFEPDDFLIKALLVKQFAEKQITVSDEIINFIASRIERSYIAIVNVVEKIDNAALAEKREITLPFVKKTIGL